MIDKTIKTRSQIDLSKMPTECPCCNGSGKNEGNPASKLVWLRTELGYDQQGVANELEMNRSMLSNIENNRQNLTPETLIKFCKYYDVSADWLLGLDKGDGS